ncbi:MAG TPA: tetratricopeptide repeat protein [Gemmatimonadaceae bacterium]|jgi:protein O-mannosyl-transferase|nr:tetratricopeptide repeat protein [Gemmatimonadaceae bacterium]
MSARGKSTRRSRPKSEPASERSLRFGRREWLVCAGLALGIAAIYAPVATHGFVNWDDPEYVTNNPMVRRGITLVGLWWASTTTHAANWHPVTWLSHMVDVQIFGLQAGWHHIVSVLLHITSSVLLFGWLRRTTGAFGRSAVVAALFAVHPTHVESVAWVAERKDTLSTVFLMVSLWTYTEYVRRPSRWRYLAVFVSVALGLMAKPMLVTLPFVLLLVDVWPLRRFSFSQQEGGKWLPPWRLVTEKLPLLALSVASAVATFVAQSRGGAVARLDAYPFGLRAVNALISYVAYIGQAFWPARLAVVYPPRAVPAVWTVAAAFATLVLITALVIRSATRRPYALVGWLWYLGTLVPVIGLVQVGSQPMADRYTYVPLIGLFIIVVWGAHDLFAGRVAWRSVPAVGAAIAISACAVLARAQVGYWRDDLTLWTHALAVTGPNSRAHNNLANALSDRHDVADAIAHYREAVKIKPDFGEAHSNLANSLAGQGMVDEAEREYEAALRYRPTDPFAHNGLGSLLDEQGKLAEAISHYEAALRTAPDMADVHNNLAVALTKQGRLDDAISEFLQAIRANPSGASFHYNLGVTLIQRGDSAQARKHLEAALELNPGFDAARQALGALASKR